jgi:hypothetical protein
VQSLDLESSAGEPEEASLAIHQRVRQNLERLAHVEFDAGECEEGWRVVPPCLALCQHGPAAVTAVLCGARTARLLKNIENTSTGLTFERVGYVDCPDIVRIRASDPEPLAAFAEIHKLRFEPDSPSALLSHVPPIDSFSGWRREAMPSSGKDWKVEHFVIEKKVVKWHPVKIEEANAPAAQGLFRFTLYQRPTYFLREGRTTVTVPGAVGKYRVALGWKRRFVKYDRAGRGLTVPAIFRPPLLTERALILCSGFPPSLTAPGKRPLLTYRDVPEEVAGMAAEVLKQDFA